MAMQLPHFMHFCLSFNKSIPKDIKFVPFTVNCSYHLLSDRHACCLTCNELAKCTGGNNKKYSTAVIYSRAKGPFQNAETFLKVVQNA